jgi:hypothetical protein
MRIRDPKWKIFGSGTQDGKISDPGSGINILDPQHRLIIYYTVYGLGESACLWWRAAVSGSDVDAAGRRGRDPGSRAGAGWTLLTGRRTPPAGCLGTPANVPRY